MDMLAFANRLLAGPNQKKEYMFNVINLLYNSIMFTGTWDECTKYQHDMFGTSCTTLLVDIRPCS